MRDGREFDVTPGWIGVAGHILMIKDMNSPASRELVQEAVRVLECLINHIFKTRLPLAKMLALQLSAFEQVCGPLPQRVTQHQRWDVMCTSQSRNNGLDSHPCLTFLKKSPYLNDRSWANACCWFSFITGFNIINLNLFFFLKKKG
jgi:hypothetical protein